MNVLLIHTTPNTAIVACPAEANRLALVTCAAVVLQKRIISPVAASMIIMIMDGICTWPDAFTEKPGLNPSFSANTGNNDGKDPSNTTAITATAKIATDLVAPSLRARTLSFESSRFFANAGSFILSKNSGSLSSSFPLFQTNKMPAITPIIVDGIQMRRMSASLISASASTANKVPAAADTGLAVMAIWAAVTLILIALSGRILFLIAISAIIGRTE